MMNVLFVCTHHVARSPMVAATCRELVSVRSQHVVRLGCRAATMWAS
jgi:protein-tyrosine-phosphatase